MSSYQKRTTQTDLQGVLVKTKNLQFTAKQEIEAEIRNKLTMPLTVLNQFVDGKSLPKKKVVLAIKNLNEILKVLEE